MTDMNVVVKWWARIRENVAAARQLVERIESAGRSDADLNWALVKYIENVTESIKQLDAATNRELLDLFIEIPADRSDEKLSWKNLKGLRDVVVHSFWEIDHELILHKAKYEFLQLQELLDHIRFIYEPDGAGTGFSIYDPASLNPRALLSPQATFWRYGYAVDDPPSIGRSDIWIGYSEKTGLTIFRSGWHGASFDRVISFASAKTPHQWMIVEASEQLKIGLAEQGIRTRIDWIEAFYALLGEEDEIEQESTATTDLTDESARVHLDNGYVSGDE